MHFWTWLAAAGVLLFIEIVTLSLVFASFALAAVVAGVVNLAGGNVALQIIALIVSAVISLAFVKPFAKKVLFKSSPIGTGVDLLISSDARALSEITKDGGTIRLKDETWSAKSALGVIDAGTELTVLDIQGAIAIVVPKTSREGE